MARLVFVLLILVHALVTAACGTFNIEAPVTTTAPPQTSSDQPSSEQAASVVAESEPAASVSPPQAKRARSSAPAINLAWKDPATNYTWRVVALQVPFSEAKCPKGSLLPETVIPPKFADFLLSHAGALADDGLYWTSLKGTLGEIARTIESNGDDLFDTDEKSLHVTVCVERI